MSEECERTEDEFGIESFFKSYSPVFNLPVNGTVSIDLKVGGYVPTYLFGDSSECERGDPISHTYNETAPYQARIGDIDRSRITEFELINSLVDNIDLESFRQLHTVDISGNKLTSLDVSRNNALLSVDVSNNLIPEADIDALIIGLDIFGLERGVLNYEENEKPTSLSSEAYCNLIDKGWLITGQIPAGGFTIIINTTLPGQTNINQFLFAGFGTYDISWGDCEFEFDVTGSQLHTYETPGIYTISVSSTLERVFMSAGDGDKLIEIVKWGSGVWTSMENAFFSCPNLAIVSATDVPDLSNVTNASGMFNNCFGLTFLDVSQWQTSSITRMSHMFDNCNSLTVLDVSLFNTSNVTLMDNMFNGCNSLTVLDVSSFNTSNVLLMNNMFNGCSGLTVLDVSLFNTANVTDMNNMFDNCSGVSVLNVSGFDTSNVTNMNNMFDKCSGVSVLDVALWVTNNVNNFSNIFSGCASLTTLPVGLWNTSSATNMGNMFANCTGLTTLDASGFSVNNVTNMGNMFNSCENLVVIDVALWVTTSLVNTVDMFDGCESVVVLDFALFDTSNVTAMNSMFRGCLSLTTLNVTSFNVGNVVNMGSMFSSCASLAVLDLSGFITTSVTAMNIMFSGCSLLDVDVSNFNISSLTNATSMFLNSAFSTTNYDLLLVAWEGQAHNNSVTFHAGSAQFSAGAPAIARAALVSDSWVISDGGPV